MDNLNLGICQLLPSKKWQGTQPVIRAETSKAVTFRRNQW